MEGLYHGEIPVDILNQLSIDISSKLSKNSDLGCYIISDEYEQPIAEFVNELKSDGICDRKGRKLSIELKEIDGSDFNFEFARNLSAPEGKDMGILIVHNLLNFIGKVHGMEQGRTIGRAQGNIDNTSKHWLVVFTVVCEDNSKWIHEDCANCSTYISLTYDIGENK